MSSAPPDESAKPIQVISATSVPGLPAEPVSGLAELARPVQGNVPSSAAPTPGPVFSISYGAFLHENPRKTDMQLVLLLPQEALLPSLCGPRQA